MTSLYSKCLVVTVILIAVLQVSGLNPCIESPCSCCISGTCEDPASHPYPCRGCMNGRTGPSCHEPCPETCVNCSQHYFDYKTEKICYMCKSGYYLGRYKDVPSYPLLQDCSLSCNVGCESCTSFYNCSFCKAGYFMDSTQECKKCPEHCVQCTSENTCSQCSDGYERNGKYCQPCKPNCKRCKTNGECIGCYGEFYLSETECKRCQSGCLSCSNEQFCSECKTGYYINDSICLACRNNCLSCALKFQYTCNECATGFYRSNEECHKCPQGCASCKTGTGCQTCDPYYKLLNGICYICPSTCDECSADNVCISCLEKHYKENGNCLRCPERCLTCANTQKCLSCMDSFYGTLCSKHCRENCKSNVCYIDTGICVTCNAAYFKDNDHICKQCPDHCTVCSSNSSCLECQAGYMGLKCENACPHCKPGTSCDKYSGYCHEECKDGFSGKVCDKHCEVKCLSCDRGNPSKCRACASNRYGSACIQVCPSTCLNNTCNDNDGSCTYECNPGFWGPRCEHDCANNCSENACFRNNGTCKQLCKGSYGKGCQYSCSVGCSQKLCNYTTGECLKGCLHGFKGQFCEKDAQNGEVIAAIIIPVTAVVVIAVVIFVIFYVQRRQRWPCKTEIEETASLPTDEKQRQMDDVGSGEETLLISSCAESADYSPDNEEVSGARTPLISSRADSEDNPPKTFKDIVLRFSAAAGADNSVNGISESTKSEKKESAKLHETMQSVEISSKSQPEQRLAKSLHISLQPKKEPSVTAHHEQRPSETIQPKQDTKATVEESFVKKHLEHEQKTLLQPHQVTLLKVLSKHGLSTTIQFKKEAPVAAQSKQDKFVAVQLQPEDLSTVQPEQHIALSLETEKETSKVAQPDTERFIALQPAQNSLLTLPPEEHTSVPVETKKETSVAAQAKQEKSAGIPHGQEVLFTVQPVLNTSASVEANQGKSVVIKPEQKQSPKLHPEQETSVEVQPKLEKSVEVPQGKEASSIVVPEKNTSASDETRQETSVVAQADKENSVVIPSEQKPSSTLHSEKETFSTLHHEQETSLTLHPEQETSFTLHPEQETPLTVQHEQETSSTFQHEQETLVDTEEGDKNTKMLPLDQLKEVLETSNIEFQHLQQIDLKEGAHRNRVNKAPYLLNARHISGNNNEEYIVSLEPHSLNVNKSKEVSQFWRMVWENDCGCIICLENTSTEEKSPGSRYWPRNKEKNTYDNIMVETGQETPKTDSLYVSRKIYMTSGQPSETKEVYHVDYYAWLDQGFPKDLSHLAKLTDELETYNLGGPILVHCRYDIGKTGVFIAFHILTKEAREEGRVDIYGCVKKLRQQCPTMFQTEEQYKALYKALIKWKDRQTESSCSSGNTSDNKV